MKPPLSHHTSDTVPIHCNHCCTASGTHPRHASHPHTPHTVQVRRHTAWPSLPLLPEQFLFQNMDDGSPYCHRKSIFLSMLHSVFRSQKTVLHSPPSPRRHCPLPRSSNTAFSAPDPASPDRKDCSPYHPLRNQTADAPSLHPMLHGFSHSSVFFLPRLSLSRKRPFSPSGTPLDFPDDSPVRDKFSFQYPPPSYF